MTFVIRMSSGEPPIPGTVAAPHPGGMEKTTTPTLRTKLIFWALLSVLSVAIAEVSVASAPFAFVNPVETAFLTLFYGSHLLLFAWLGFRRGWPTLPALWLGGVLFGLYEFYITKVLWEPPWGDVISLAHIDVVALVVLAFFWHPFMAFILPLAIGEAVGTRGRWVARQLPAWFTGASRRSILIAFAIVGLTHGLMTGSPGVAIISTASALSAFLVTASWWRRGGRATRWGLRDLLPNDKQGKRIALVLALQYVVFIPLWNADSIPPLLGHVIVWLLYAGFALLFHSALKDSISSSPVPTGSPAIWPRNRVIQWAGALLFLSALGSLGQPEIGFVVVWIGAIVAGLRMLVGTLRHAVRTPVGDATAEPAVVRDDDQAHTS